MIVSERSPEVKEHVGNSSWKSLDRARDGMMLCHSALALDQECGTRFAQTGTQFGCDGH